MVNLSPSPQPQPQPSPDPTLAGPSYEWIQSLADHPILNNNQTYSSSNQNQNQNQKRGLRSALIATTSSELILATGNQLRSCSLVEAKHSAENGNVPSYKILNHSLLNYPVQAIYTNPPGSLLAVVGSHKILIVVLPRSSSLGSGQRPDSVRPDARAQTIDVKAVLLGSYYHNPRNGSDALVSKVMWHPWGVGGNTLLVLTRDGYLREYDVSEDSAEPTQTLSLLPSTPPYHPPSSSSHKRLRSRSRSRSVSIFRNENSSMTASWTDNFTSSRIGLDNKRARSTLDEEAEFGDPATEAASFTLGLDVNAFTSLDDPSHQDADYFENGPQGANKTSSRNNLGSEGRDEDLPQSDWSPLTIFACARNGDTYALCPYLPAHASIPPSYIHLLSYYVSASNSNPSFPDPTLSRQRDLSSRFVTILLRQAKEKIEEARYDSRKKGRESALTPRLRDFGLSSTNEKRNGRETRSISRRFSGTPMSIDASTPSRDLGPTYQNEGDDDEEQADSLVTFDKPVNIISPSIFAPSLFDSNPEVQGPFLLSPAPEELYQEREATATDLLFSRITASTTSTSNGIKDKDLEVLIISNDDGRVDLCLNLAKIEAKWSKKSKESPSAKSRPGRYGLSNSSDESDLDDEPVNRSGTFVNPNQDALPSLFVYETLDLGLSASLASSSTLDEDGSLVEEILSTNVPTLVLDPLYSDTIYVYHSLGVHAICISKWARQLCTVLASSRSSQHQQDHGSDSSSQDDDTFDSSELTRFLHSQVPSEVAWVIKTFSPSVIAEALSNPDSIRSSMIPTWISGLTLLSDVYLGYILLAITDDLQLVALELSLRIADLDPDDPEVGGSTKVETETHPKGYISLLGSEPFIPPAPFSSSTTGLPSAPRLTNPNVPGGQSELKVTPNTLRFLAERANQLRTEMRDVVKAGNSVQARLTLQVKELQRQLEKLADIKNRSAGVINRSVSNPKSRTFNNPAQNETLDQRLNRVERKQLELIKRTDSTLQKLMDSNQPIISQSERKWFDELDLLSREVGISSNDGDRGEKRGLKLVEEKLEYQLDQLRPSMQELAAKKQAQESSSRPNQALGASQLQKLERLLGEESRLLMEAKNKAQSLNSRISRDLGRISS